MICFEGVFFLAGVAGMEPPLPLAVFFKPATYSLMAFAVGWNGLSAVNEMSASEALGVMCLSQRTILLGPVLCDFGVCWLDAVDQKQEQLLVRFRGPQPDHDGEGCALGRSQPRVVVGVVRV